MTSAFKALDAGDSWDFSANDTPKCPHCGEDFDITHNEAWHLYDENDTHDIECPSCQLEFQVISSANWTFCTDEQERQP